MWLFTKYGFYSAVCARQADGDDNQPVDPDRIMVRARLREHLEGLQKRFPDLLGECTMHVLPHRDYRYRIYVEKPVWTQVLAGLSQEMDYNNFKSEVAEFQGNDGAAYEEALHKIWSVMHRLQK